MDTELTTTGSMSAAGDASAGRCPVPVASPNTGWFKRGRDRSFAINRFPYRRTVGSALVAAVCALIGLPFAEAQFRPDYREIQFEAERARLEQAEHALRQRSQASQAARSARAHARMAEEGAFSVTGSPVGWESAHPGIFGTGDGSFANYNYTAVPGPLAPPLATLLDLPIWQDVAPDDEPLPSLFSEFISGSVVQAKCVLCHVEAGVSGNTRLVFSRSSAQDHVELNRKVFEDFVATVDDAVELILNKIQGVAHGGGMQVAAGTADFANMERFLRGLESGDSPGGTGGSGVTAQTLFDGVAMASPARTLRRAAILFAGRLPTREELAAVADGRESSLRLAIRGLMSGEGFHDFLIRGSNDRLLTDRQIDQGVIGNASVEFVEINRKFREMAYTAFSRGYENFWEDPAFNDWDNATAYGQARAPLELIAHVVENDRPYTEILTGDYIMANPMAAEGYGAATSFENANDQFEFKPSEIASYYRNDDSKVTEHDEALDVGIVTSPGNLATDYPHAGILNTTAFLIRYPSTATNRNRARSRWTYYHFLGLDVEKSASRTTDPAALADTNNPTLNNPACTVCHSVLDPVAGAFQNYGDEGLYRDQWGGKDSLPNLYKWPEDGSPSQYREGDTWYRDMRAPGFGTGVAPDPANSAQWLAQRMVADARFAEAAVKFWWQPIMGGEVLDPPEDSGDADFQARLVAATAQAAEVSRLAAAFRTGIAGGRAYNGKDLLAEIALSPWFRAESVTGDDPVRMAALRDAGMARLLTPEELERKTEAVSGFVWGRRFHRTMAPDIWARSSRLGGGRGWDTYETLYGGIDSDGITTRATDMTPVMAALAQNYAAEVSCPIVRREFFFWEHADRQLFGGIDRFDSPVSETYGQFDVTADTWATRQTFSLEAPLAAGSKTIQLAFTNNYHDDENDLDRNLKIDRVTVRDSTGATIRQIELELLGRDHCRGPADPFDSYQTFWCNADLSVPVEIDHDDIYRIDIVAHQDAAGDEPARMSVMVESDDGVSAGAAAIRNKLVDLHLKLLGVEVAPNSADVNEAFSIFFEVWSHMRRTTGTEFGASQFECGEYDHAYYDGMISDLVVLDEWGNSNLDWNRVNAFYDEADMNDPSYAVRAWVITLAYLMTDFRYLYF